METQEKDFTIEELKELHKKVLTDEVLSKLEEAFKYDFTNEEASNYAGIARATYQKYYAISSEFRQKMDTAKQYCITMAKKNIQVSVRKGNTEDSRWLLEHRQNKIYSKKVETENKNYNYDNLIKDFDDEYQPDELKQVKIEGMENQPPVQDQGQERGPDNIQA